MFQPLGIGVDNRGTGVFLLVWTVYSYQNKHVEDLVQLVFSPFPDAQWVNSHNAVPLKSSGHDFGNGVAVST